MDRLRVFRKIVEYKNEVMSRSPRQKCIFIHKWATMVLRCIGCHITDPNFKFNWVSCIPAYLFAEFFLFGAYTSAYYFSKHNIPKALEPFCLVGVGVSGIIHYLKVALPSNLTKSRALFSFGRDVIYTESKEGRLGPILDRRANQLIKQTTFSWSVVCFSGALICIYPTYIFGTQGLASRLRPIPILIPFMEPDSEPEYYISLSQQLLMTFSGLTGSIGIETLFLLMVNNLWAATDVIQHSLEELELAVKNGESVAQRRQLLRNIFKQIKDVDWYIICVDAEFYLKYFTQPNLATYGIALCIFCAVQNDWVSGYGGAALMYSQLLILCFTGNAVDEVYTRMIYLITQFKWYELSISEQKDVGRMLHQIQNGRQLSIGPFGEINFGTATTITKRIYTFLMLLFTLVGTD